MNKIVRKEHFSENVVMLEVEAPLIAKSRKAGHFVIVRIWEKGERIPLTIAGADTEKGTITLVCQKVGVSSTKLCEMNVGDEILDVVGPLGKATHIENFGTVVCAGGGVGAVLVGTPGACTSRFRPNPKILLPNNSISISVFLSCKTVLWVYRSKFGAIFSAVITSLYCAAFWYFQSAHALTIRSQILPPTRRSFGWSVNSYCPM